MSKIPRPRGLPVVGNVHQLGSKSHEVLTKLSRRYGEVFRLRLGSLKVVVLCGGSAINQALVTQTADFAGRPEDLATLRAFNSVRGGTYSLSTYGGGWECLHRFLVTALREFSDGAGKSIFERNVSDEALKLVEFVTRDQASVFDAEVLLHHSTANLLTRFLFSSHHELNDSVLGEFLEVHEELWFHWGRCGILHVFPWLEKLLGSRMSNLMTVIRRQKEVLETIRDEQCRYYVGGSKKDLMSYIRTEAVDLDFDVLDKLGMTRDKFHDLVFEMFAGGHGNTYSFLNWAFLHAIVFPELQEEIQGEIYSVVGRERTPNLADREKLPLTEAFLVEVTRHSSLSPVTPPHSTTRDTVLGGDFNFALPEGTTVICNLHSVFHDPATWAEPDRFNPKRFLKGDVDNVSLDAEKVSAVMRFGGGTRMCTGRKLATAQVFLFFAVVVHQCTLRNVEGQELSLEGIMFPLGIRPPETKMELVRR